MKIFSDGIIGRVMKMNEEKWKELIKEMSRTAIGIDIILKKSIVTIKIWSYFS